MSLRLLYLIFQQILGLVVLMGRTSRPNGHRETWSSTAALGALME